MYCDEKKKRTFRCFLHPTKFTISPYKGLKGRIRPRGTQKRERRVREERERERERESRERKREKNRENSPKNSLLRSGPENILEHYENA